MKNNAFKIAVIVLFALVILLPWGLSLAGADSETGGGDAKEIRALAEWPTEFSNDYFVKIDSYVSDHSPMRNRIIDLLTGVSDALKGFYVKNIVAPLMRFDNDPDPSAAAVDFSGIFSAPEADSPIHKHDYAVIREQKASYSHDGYTLEKCSVCGEVRVSNLVRRTELDGFYNGKPPVLYSGSGFAGLHDWYFYSLDNSIGYVQGDNTLSESEMESWKNTLEELQTECGKRGVDLVVLVCPNKEQVYPEYLPMGIDLSKPDSEKREPLMAEYMKTHSSVKYVYPLAQEKTAKMIYETYLQQDTHWNSVGGFIAAMQVYAALGIPRTGLDEVAVDEYRTTGGDMVNLGIGPASEYTNYAVRYKPEIDCVQTHSFSNTVVDDNENPNIELRVLESNAAGDHKAVIIGDSFRHAIAPIIAKDYAKLTVGHRENFDLVSNYEADADGNVSPCGRAVLQDAVAELGEGDLLILSTVERFDDLNIEAAQKLIDFLKSSGK